MSKLTLTPNNILDVPAVGRAHVYVKADNTLAIRDSDGDEFVLADTSKDMSAVPRRLLAGRSRITAAQAAGVYWFTDAATLASAGLATPLAGIYIDAADFPTVAGVAPLLKMRCQVYTNDVAPGSTFTLGLYPVSRPTVSGGAGVLIYTPGTVVPNSTAVFTTPAADAMLTVNTVDFAVPATGHYAIGFVSSALIALNAHVHMQFHLQVHN